MVTYFHESLLLIKKNLSIGKLGHNLSLEGNDTILVKYCGNYKYLELEINEDGRHDLGQSRIHLR
jgi:hypothetical protein